MKKNILFVAAILALSTATYAAPETKAKPTVTETKNADVKTTDVKAVEVKADTKVVEAKPALDKSKLISNFTGTIEYKSDLFGTESKTDSTTNRPYATTYNITGATAVETKSSIKTTQNTTGFLNLDKDDEEPKAIVDLGAKVFDAYDLKLSLKALYDKDEQYKGTAGAGNLDPTKVTEYAQESSTFAISRTWADAYVEWKSNINLDGGTLFNALVEDSSFTIRKQIGKVEGQIKAGRVTDAVGKGKYGIDTTSVDTYIKVMPKSNLNITLRPYDIDWKTGKEFKNNNLNRTPNIADTTANGVISGFTVYKTTDLLESFDNKLPKNQFYIPGVELDYTKGNVKYFGKANAEIVKSITRETVTLGTGVNDKDKVVSKITEKTNARNVITFLLGADVKINDVTKIIATTMYDKDRFAASPENRETETTTYTTPTTLTTLLSESKNEKDGNYFTFNIFGETKVSKIKLEAEMDYRNSAYSEANVTSNGVIRTTTNPETSVNMLGLFGKATFENVKFVVPYISTKYTRKAIEDKNSGSSVTIATGVTTSNSLKITESYDKLEFTVGAEKKYDALSIGAEFTVSNASYSELKQNSSITTATTIETLDYTAEKVDLGVNTLASVKATYKF